MTWYCIRTMRRAELSLADELRKLGLTAYVPVETHDRKVRGRKERVTIPAFGGFAFVDCEPDDFDEIRVCEGFWRFVCYQGSAEPAKMPRGALLSVFLAELFGDLDHTREPPPWRPSRGDVVSVRSGMWRGRLARIVSVGKRRSMLELLEDHGRWNVPNEALELAA